MTGMQHLKYMMLGGGALFLVLLLLGAAPQSAVFIAIALACPLMMVFMMGGHSGHDAHQAPGPRGSEADDPSPRDSHVHH
jgi:hypothetical protein